MLLMLFNRLLQMKRTFQTSVSSSQQIFTPVLKLHTANKRVHRKLSELPAGKISSRLSSAKSATEASSTSGIMTKIRRCIESRPRNQKNLC